MIDIALVGLKVEKTTLRLFPPSNLAHIFISKYTPATLIAPKSAKYLLKAQQRPVYSLWLSKNALA